MNCTYSQYSLPTIEFVGGETQKLMFNAYHYQSRDVFDLSGCTYSFSVVSATNKVGTPVITKTGSITESYSISVTLDPRDTVNLYGKYIYQISIKASNGTIEIPKQGVLYITNNINKTFVG